MIITITKRGKRKDEVEFVTPYGEGRGIWCSSAPLGPGDEVQVEFELVQLLMRWIDILPSESSDYSIRLEQDRMILSGRLDNIEEDGTAFLKLGDSLIMFECLGEPMALGTFVEVRTSELRLYPVAY
jgi:hypothetical protein